MNKERRAKIERMNNELSGLLSEAEELRDAEQEAFDSMPESLQEGERGEKMQEAISALEELISAIGEFDNFASSV